MSIIDMSKDEEMQKIKRLIDSCQKCSLWETRSHAVTGEGSCSADIMFIGEAPGYNEDKQGRPFVGRAGKVLDEMLASVDLDRNDVFIANILKCRPPNNRNPRKVEIENCTEYLDRQIEIIQPMILVPLGNFACTYIFEKFSISPKKISDVHGKVFQKTTLLGSLYIIPFFHPAVATYNPSKKTVLIQDMQKIMDVLNENIVEI